MIIETSNVNFRNFPPVGSYVKINKYGELIRGRRDKHRIGIILSYSLPKDITRKIKPNSCTYRVCLDNIPNTISIGWYPNGEEAD